MRGKLTEEIRQKAKELLLGYDLTTKGLRLLPYVQSVVMNEKIIDIIKIDANEVDLLDDWIQRGWIKCSERLEDVEVTKEFWDAMHEILWLGYAKN